MKHLAERVRLPHEVREVQYPNNRWFVTRLIPDTRFKREVIATFEDRDSALELARITPGGRAERHRGSAIITTRMSAGAPPIRTGY